MAHLRPRRVQPAAAVGVVDEMSGKPLGGLGETESREAADLAAKARSIAEDVNHVCGQERCIGSLSLAVLLLSEAVQAFLDSPRRPA